MLPTSHMFETEEIFEAVTLMRGKMFLFKGESMYWDFTLNIDNNWANIIFDRGNLKNGVECKINFVDKTFHDPFKTPGGFDSSDYDKEDYEKGTYELKGQFDKDKVDAILTVKGTSLNGQYKLTEVGQSRFLKKKKYTIKKIK